MVDIYTMNKDRCMVKMNEFDVPRIFIFPFRCANRADGKFS